MSDPRILGPIPTPPAQRWREVRLIYLPRIIFAVGVLVAVWLWSDWVAPASLVAEAESTQSEVRSTQAGILVGLKVEALDEVRAGQVLGQVTPANPRLLEANLAVIRADVGMLTASMAGVTDRQRVSLEFERMQLDWMSHRVDLATLQGKLVQAEADLTHAEPMQKAGLITVQDYEQLKNNRDSLAHQIAELAKLVAHLEPSVATFPSPEKVAVDLSPDTALAAAIKVQEAKLKLAEEQATPAPLTAALDGVVSIVLRHAGEAVVAGDPVLRITAAQPDRLAGYIRQPLTLIPKPGMTAELRTRSVPRRVIATKISQVGPSFEAIPPSILPALRLPTTPAPERALRVEFVIPSGLKLRPGEHLDVIIR